MKKIIAMLLTVVMIFSVMSFSAMAENDISVVIDDVAQKYDVMPIIENGRTLVPLRGIFEALNAEVMWDDATKTVTATKGDTKVVLKIGDTLALVNDKEITLDVPAKIVEGRTLVPVRFVSEALGCKVDWIDDTMTVVIKSTSSMAPLKSDYHRAVPTTFTKSNDLNDIMHFDRETPEEQEIKYANVKKDGEVVCTEDEFTQGIEPQTTTYGSWEIVDVEGQPFKKALRMTCTAVPTHSKNFLAKTTATPERNPGDGVNKNDLMLLAFRLRTVSGGQNGLGKVQVQIEHPETYVKAIFEFATANEEWTIIYMPFTGVENATSIGIRAGFYEQVVELGGIEIINFGPDYDIENLPVTTAFHPELEKDASWRKEANKRIEEIRKGDFSVVVKDKDGNLIKDAEVNFNMFEHEFQFGNMVQYYVYDDETTKKNQEMLFNGAVIEHYLKWAPFEQNREEAIKQVEGAKTAGAKYIRGHSIFWDKDNSNSKSELTPEYMLTEEILTNRALFDEKCKAHVMDICGTFKEDITDWDVINETILCTKHRDVYGPEIYKQWFDWAREYAGEDCKLYYNEAGYVPPYVETFYQRLDELEALKVDYDGIGLQSHYDGDLKMPSALMELYDSLDKYGKRLKVTEYSCGIVDENLQANYTRDVLISAFAEDKMDGFFFWGFWDPSSYAKHTPFYDENWRLKPAGEIYCDLVYNKWWTRDLKAITDENGKATINGFYGDYDVTVNVNGKTKTVACAYHKGYDNVLEFIIE